MKKTLLFISLAAAASAQAQPATQTPAANVTGKTYSTSQRAAPGQPGVVQTTPLQPVVIAPPPPPPILINYQQRPPSYR